MAGEKPGRQSTWAVRRERWGEVIADIVATGGLAKSLAVEQLYALALADGHAILVRKFGQLRNDQREDFIHDVLFRLGDELLLAQNPRAYFVVSLVHLVTSYYRTPEAKRVRPTEDIERVAEGFAGAKNEHLRGPEQALIKAETTSRLASALSLLSEREREVLLDLSYDFPVPETCARLRLTEANLYQVRHRALERLRMLLVEEEGA